LRRYVDFFVVNDRDESCLTMEVMAFAELIHEVGIEQLGMRDGLVLLTSESSK